MQSTHTAAVPANQVSTLFADRALLFGLSKGAPFVELAERLSDMCDWHTGTPIAVSLKFGANWPTVGDHQSGV
jgi:hypothetical protein